ncbi:hypothetical protein M0R45_036458 [Rubus argutus]|uniref:Uncharacterized protein n=1 Tax=Rubus argutus TaxID=59490 RepID=A0AAW1VX17_RUBAR
MGTVKEWFGKHLYFSKATMCILGLVFSYSLVDHADNVYLDHRYPRLWHLEETTFPIAGCNYKCARWVIIHHGARFSSFATHLRGLFKIIVTTNAACVVGLCILWSSTVDMSAEIAATVFYGAVVLLTLGEAGRSAALNEFLDEQYLSEQDQTECIDNKKLQDRQKALWSLPWFLGAVVAFSLKETTREQTIKISTIVMGVFYLFFCFGYSYYFIYGKSPSVIEAEPVYPIEEAERDETCIDTEENYIEHVEEICKDTEENYIEQVQSLEICIDTGGARSKTSKKREVLGCDKKNEGRKHFRNEILAIWLTFLVYSVVTAAGNTFFFEQMDSLREPPIKPIAIIFYELDSLSKYITSHLWESLPKKWKSNSRVRIGCGMVCTVLCCVVAWQVEIRRLKEAVKQGVKDDQSKTSSMSIFWLVPQFSLLGIMEGLAVDGLIDFVVDRVAGDDDKAVVRYYASHTTDFVIGVGKLLTALSVLAFRRRWFNDSIT